MKLLFTIRAGMFSLFMLVLSACDFEQDIILYEANDELVAVALPLTWNVGSVQELLWFDPGLASQHIALHNAAPIAGVGLLTIRAYDSGGELVATGPSFVYDLSGPSSSTYTLTVNVFSWAGVANFIFGLDSSVAKVVFSPYVEVAQTGEPVSVCVEAYYSGQALLGEETCRTYPHTCTCAAPPPQHRGRQ